MMNKHLSAIALVVGLSSIAPVVAADHIYEGQSFYGDWSLYGGGSIYLGDGGGMALDLEGTDRYCVTPGSSYSRMNNYIQSNYPSPVSWFVDEVCSDGYVRICVYSAGGSMACSTYEDYGWVWR